MQINNVCVCFFCILILSRNHKDPQLEPIHAAFFDNGDLIVAMRPESICANVEKIGSDLVNLMLDTSNNLTVTASIALTKKQPELAALLERIS